ncbi:MAG: peptidoglycan-binding protein [Clostridia bacterium]|nr:peptidoglycan-binding protein [Clostridia bacterium]
MKKLISLILMMMVVCLPAYALEKAASAPDWDALERYAAFEEKGTVWSVRSNQTEAALARIGSEIAPYTGYACFGLELTGDRETGVAVPVLTFYYAGSLQLNGRYASVAVNGQRYDIALCSEPVQLGKNKAEKLTAPLDRDGLALMHEILNAEEVAIALVGDSTFRMEPEKKSSYASAREELSARSLDGIADMLREFEAMPSYNLWDLNEDWWVRTRGVEPGMQITALPEEEELEIAGVKLEEPLFMLSRGDTGDKVRELQELLIDAGYLQGTADGGYGEGTVRAVRAAQKWLGLAGTGNADETLISILTSEAPVLDGTAADTMAVSTVEKHIAEGLCELTVERYWTADAVESAGGDRRSVSDKDDTLIIYEGTVKNLSTEKLDFYWQLSATVKLGEYEYPCVLVCERNEGASLASALPPLGEARLLIYAEIPETIAGETGWKLELEAEDTVFLFE